MHESTAFQIEPARMDAWLALSELFLDTALDDDDITAIVRQLKATGLAPADIEHIYEEEVAPVCWHNLLALPGGAWTGFRKEALVRAIVTQLRRPPWLHDVHFIRRLRIRRWTAMSRSDWQRVKAQLVA